MCKDLNRPAPDDSNEPKQQSPINGAEMDQTPWQKTITSHFLQWLSELSGPPEPSQEAPMPDLYSFYEELCVTRNEFRKHMRRSHEVFGTLGERLERFDQVLKVIGRHLETAQNETTAGGAEKALLLHLVELYQRLKRFENILDEHASGEGTDRRWWNNLRRKLGYALIGVSEPTKKQVGSLQQGFSIIVASVEDLLASQSLRKIETGGKPFDPLRMTAVGGIETEDVLPDTVVEEVGPGFLLKNQVLKYAQVIVATKKGVTR